jgi:hypothetical protein
MFGCNREYRHREIPSCEEHGPVVSLVIGTQNWVISYAKLLTGIRIRLGVKNLPDVVHQDIIQKGFLQH